MTVIHAYYLCFHCYARCIAIYMRTWALQHPPIFMGFFNKCNISKPLGVLYFRDKINN